MVAFGGRCPIQLGDSREMVLPVGIEPTCPAPQASALSVELWKQRLSPGPELNGLLAGLWNGGDDMSRAAPLTPTLPLSYLGTKGVGRPRPKTGRPKTYITYGVMSKCAGTRSRACPGHDAVLGVVQETRNPGSFGPGLLGGDPVRGLLREKLRDGDRLDRICLATDGLATALMAHARIRDVRGHGARFHSPFGGDGGGCDGGLREHGKVKLLG